MPGNTGLDGAHTHVSKRVWQIGGSSALGVGAAAITGKKREVAGAIEALISSYMNGVHEAAQQAMERAFVRPLGRPPRGASKVMPVARTARRRRDGAELVQLCSQLFEIVRAHPGASMASLAQEAGVDARSLQRPMAKLRSSGRVRSVGQRQLTRYYPAAQRSSAGKD